MNRSRTRSACISLALMFLALAAPALADAHSDIVALFNEADVVAANNDFSQGERVSLVTKLIGALAAVDRGHENTAANNLGAFINEVEAMERSGRISSAEADALITAAQAIVDQL